MFIRSSVSAKRCYLNELVRCSKNKRNVIKAKSGMVSICFRSALHFFPYQQAHDQQVSSLHEINREFFYFFKEKKTISLLPFLDDHRQLNVPPISFHQQKVKVYCGSLIQIDERKENQTHEI